ncbi:MAG: amidohydrolase family protein [Proteobacteria bacterium]|jgi:predicted TIM-barrel fold metal-dependent hydrolase|nr:amidohydrolase family protein [Pseudomonadota bacterium]
MSYAGDMVVYDADSHLMELPDYLTANADADVRAQLPEIGAATTSVFDPGAHRGKRGHDPETMATLLALGDNLTRGPKWHDALGAFSGSERSMALDLLGFKRQVIFSTFCARLIFGADDAQVSYGAATAQNRAMRDFVSDDDRLIGVAMVPLDDPQRALAEIEQCLHDGLGAVWISADAPGGRSPGHPSHDAIWARLQEARVPFILHVGSAPLSIEAPWMNDGYPDRVTARGGAEVIGSKDLTVIHHASARFISTLVLDGVLDRFPGLRGGVIEIGAGWVPDMIRRLDYAAEIWARSEPHLAQMKRRPSEQIRQQMRFTPYPFEDVAKLVGESYPELYLFSSDYPHAEGGRDPIGRFSRSTASLSATDRDLFFHRNFLDLYPA